MANLTLKLLLAGFACGGRKKGLAELFRRTAAAFGRDVPDRRGRSRRHMLSLYAAFTRQESEKAIAGGTAPAVRKDLYESSLALGRELRARLPIRSREDAAATLHALYRLLAIDKRVDNRGAVTIRRCFLADYYTPEVCRFMSAMDEGLVAGLCGGRLSFSQRLTEGADGCRGSIEWPEGEDA